MEESSANEVVEISINHKEVDVVAVVTLEDANILMNDEAAAAKYAEVPLTQQTPEPMVSEPTSEVSRHSAKHIDCLSTREATLLFLALRTKYNDKFNDRKTEKNLLWQKIAADMKSNGYSIPQGREETENCRQKFANLHKNYINYIKHMKTTGTEKRDPPPYFDEMNTILGNKDKVYPPCIEDSLDTSSNEPIASCSASCSTSSSSDQQSYSSSDFRNKQKEITNRFSGSHKSVRPTNNFNKVIDLLKEQHEQLRTDKERHMNILEDAIKVQNEQRERFLDFLQTSKRKRRCNSSSSDESLECCSIIFEVF